MCRAPRYRPAAASSLLHRPLRTRPPCTGLPRAQARAALRLAVPLLALCLAHTLLCALLSRSLPSASRTRCSAPLSSHPYAQRARLESSRRATAGRAATVAHCPCCPPSSIHLLLPPLSRLLLSLSRLSRRRVSSIVRSPAARLFHPCRRRCLGVVALDMVDVVPDQWPATTILLVPFHFVGSSQLAPP
jgi:hypothetical protein